MRNTSESTLKRFRLQFSPNKKQEARKGWSDRNSASSLPMCENFLPDAFRVGRGWLLALADVRCVRSADWFALLPRIDIGLINSLRPVKKEKKKHRHTHNESAEAAEVITESQSSRKTGDRFHTQAVNTALAQTLVSLFYRQGESLSWEWTWTRRAMNLSAWSGTQLIRCGGMREKSTIIGIIFFVTRHHHCNNCNHHHHPNQN